MALGEGGSWECMYAPNYVCGHTSMLVRACVCVYVWNMCVCIYIYICSCTHTHTHMYTHTWTHTLYTHAHTHEQTPNKRTHAHTITHTHTHTRTHTLTRTYTRTHLQTCKPVRTHTYNTKHPRTSILAQRGTARSMEDETRNAESNGNRNPEWWGDFSQLVQIEKIKSLSISRYKVELRLWLDLNSEESRSTNSNWDFCLIWICSWLKSPHHSGFRLPFDSAFRVSSSTERAVPAV